MCHLCIDRGSLKEIEESIIVTEIRKLRDFWPQFGVNLAGGFVASILFAILLTIVAFLVFNDTSPTNIGKHLKENVGEVKND